MTHGLSPITWSIGFMPVKNAVSEELGLCRLHIKTGSQTKQSDKGQQVPLSNRIRQMWLNGLGMCYRWRTTDWQRVHTSLQNYQNRVRDRVCHCHNDTWLTPNQPKSLTGWPDSSTAARPPSWWGGVAASSPRTVLWTMIANDPGKVLCFLSPDVYPHTGQ